MYSISWRTIFFPTNFKLLWHSGHTSSFSISYSTLSISTSFNDALFIPAFFVFDFFFLCTVISSMFSFICSCTFSSISFSLSKREYCSSIGVSFDSGVYSLFVPKTTRFKLFNSNFAFANSIFNFMFSSNNCSRVIALFSFLF